MEFIRNELQETIRSSAVDFAQNYLKPRVEEIETAEQFPEDLFHIMADMGFLSLSYPESYGGLGAGYLTLSMVLEEIARVSPSAATLLTVCLLPLDAIHLFGTEAQKQKYLVPGIQGAYRGSLAFTEPGTGSDPKQLTTVAKGGTENISSAGPSVLSPTPPTRGLSSSWPVTRAPTPVRPISSKNSARGIPSPSPGTKLDFMEAMSMMSSWTM